MPRFSLADINPKFLPQIEKQWHTIRTPIPVASGLPDPILEHDVGPESLDADENEKTGSGRVEVRFERRGTKLLDKDNLYGGVKWACDALRYAGLIKEDTAESIELIVTQTRVKTRKECGTLITLTPL